MAEQPHEFRRDPMTGTWVVLAANREGRPNQFVQPSNPDASPVSHRANCPFCADQRVTPPIVAQYPPSPDGSTWNDLGPPASLAWEVCVVPNLYPALTQQIPRRATKPAVDGSPELVVPAHGFHEVVIESPTHVGRVAVLSVQHFEWILRAYRDRMQAMYARGAVSVLLIKNSGPAAGATLEHVHSQIFGLPFVPPLLALEINRSKQHFRKTGHCLLCQVLKSEIADGRRIICQDQGYVAWCPYASRNGYEICLAPLEHAARFDGSDQDQLARLGGVLRRTMRALDQLGPIPFNLVLHSFPSIRTRYDCYHWHIEILPRTATLGGFEWSSGMYVNSIAPEIAANRLRM